MDVSEVVVAVLIGLGLGGGLVGVALGATLLTFRWSVDRTPRR
jgi:hypothetical protein